MTDSPFPPAPAADTADESRRCADGVLHDPVRLALLDATGLLDAAPDAALVRLTEMAAKALGVATTNVALVDCDRLFICADAAAPEATVAERVAPLQNSFCEQVVLDGAPLVLADAVDDPRFRENVFVSQHGVRAYLGVPLRIDGQVLGSLCAVDPQPRAWTSDHLTRLSEFAELASEVLRLRACRLDELLIEAVERSVLASLPDTAVLQIDANLKVTLAEGPGFRDAGLDPGVLVGRNLSDVLPAAAYAELVPRYRRALTGEIVCFDYTDTSAKVWWVQASPVRGRSGDVSAASVVMRDVTEIRAAEQALADSEAQYRLLAENCSDVISRRGLDGRFRYVSPAAERVLGWSPEALIGRDHAELVHPDDRAVIGEAYEQVLAGDTGKALTCRVRRADGGYAWVESTGTVIRDETGEIQELLWATRDITDRRAAEDANRASEALNETLFSALEEGVVIYGSDNTIIACNPSAPRMLGTPDATVAELNAIRSSRLFFDENGRSVALSERPPARVLATGEPQLGVVLAFDGEDGARHWRRVNAVPLHGSDGAIDRVLSSWADITELREAQDHARHQADHDPLTGLPNRALLRRRLPQALYSARAARHDVAVLFFDLDRFKVINDSLGHHSGDELLRAVADSLTGELRGSADLLARFAGDEFVVVARDVGGEAGATLLAERLLTVLRRPVAVGGSEHVVNASVGIALALHGEGDADDLLRDADVAMYAAKSAGRGGYRLFEADMHLQAVRRLSTESALRYAIAHDELELHYQPIWSLDPQRCTGLEALVRWRHPERGLVAPCEFIPIAEQSELILEIGDWVLARACRQMQEWRSLHGEAVPPVAVNVAARQFADPTLPGRVAELLATHELPPSALGLELTETMLMEQHGAAPRTLTALRDLGVQLILDDFGTGYSSLSHLKHLPLQVLKVDRSFIAAAEHATDESILAAIITMAHSLDLTVVAEGVETEEQLSMLRRLGSDFAQGFLLARPSRAPDIAALLSARASG